MVEGGAVPVGMVRETFRPVTFGHIRSHGCRDLLVYCASGSCHHDAIMNADHWPDEMLVRSLCSRMVCTRRGYVGADMRHRPKNRNSSPASNIRHSLKSRLGIAHRNGNRNQSHHCGKATRSSLTWRRGL